MSRILLDIGAGDSSFVNQFKNLNPGLCQTFLIGEPHFKTVWAGAVWWRQMYQVRASYENFGVSDGSLDLVTLNAFHPLNSLGDIVGEVVRCLRVGGLFISAHPVGLHPKVESPSLIQCIKPSTFMKRSGWLVPSFEATLDVEGYGNIRYPASPTITERLLILTYPALRKHARMGSYIYRNINTVPDVAVWQRV